MKRHESPQEAPSASWTPSSEQTTLRSTACQPFSPTQRCRRPAARGSYKRKGPATVEETFNFLAWDPLQRINCLFNFKKLSCLSLQIKWYNIKKSRLPWNVVFHQRSSSIKGRLPSKVVFHQRLSSIKGRLPSKVVFHWRSSFTPELPPRYPRSESSNIGLVF